MGYVRKKMMEALRLRPAIGYSIEESITATAGVAYTLLYTSLCTVCLCIIQ